MRKKLEIAENKMNAESFLISTSPIKSKARELEEEDRREVKFAARLCDYTSLKILDKKVSKK